MINPKTLEDLSRSIMEVLPTGLDQLPEELTKNLRTAMSSALARAELVTREEFDVQFAVLTRTREKLTVLEKTVGELEQQLRGSTGGRDQTQ